MGHILRRNQVKLEGQCEVGRIVSGISAVQEAETPQAEQVNVVEHHDTYAVLEVTCSCGTKLRVRCEYT
jgi:hypothetical protein